MTRFTIAALAAGLLLGSSLLQAAEEAAGKTLTWVGCGISKKAFMAELAAAYEKKSGVKIDIQGGGATRGIREVAAKNADMGGTCRHKIDGEAKERGASLEPVAWDALVVIVHPDNPVDNITFDQIRGIYLGKITNWKELGGNDAPIRLLVRKGKISGVGRALRKLVFADYNQEFKATEVMKSSGPLEKAVVEDVNAIAVTGISSARKRKVKNLKLDGKEPTYDNIRAGEYGLYRPLYLAVNRHGKNAEEVDKFIKFAHSAEGRQIIRNNGTVPYLDALKLVLKQVEQEERANERGLYQN
ncbi:phosphate ABC transporter substrate-binding protein [Sulfuriflexus mobilis]|uniref:phosphate ABC transporter substrate-binding protein n=1 Tax=Sulfuriflexus mobilis TaxID=1811807 RepID=UPI000F820F11|nr:phosphate ABC transporter substrate-binding protein [Sulfuriflexus mobilis]